MAAAVWQERDALSAGNTHWLMIFVGIVAFSMLVQALVVLGMGIGAMKLRKEMMGYVQSINAKVHPLIEKSDKLMTDLTPQVKDITAKVATITAHVEDMSELLKDKLHEFSPTISAANVTLTEANTTVRDANHKTHEQVLRVNSMVTGVLDATANMGKAIQHGVTAPVREVSGLLAGLKAGLITLINSRTKAKAPIYRAPVGTYEPVGVNVNDAFSQDVYAKDKPDLEP